MRYILDTNIWADVSREKLNCTDLRRKAGINIALAPPVIIELVRGVVRSGAERFSRNQLLFRCMTEPHSEVLPLPKVFVSTMLWSQGSGSSGVLPRHYEELMSLLIRAKSFPDFVTQTEKPSSVWKRINELDSIHEGVLEKELASLEKLARASLKALPANLARMYSVGGLLPNPEFFEDKFSAAIEFLRSSILQVRNGAKPRKNDRGLYVDQQLFFYLADPELTVVTKEDFSTEIKASPQAARIISYEKFCVL